MKKSYHSKMVPSDDAAITSRMSCGVGSAPMPPSADTLAIQPSPFRPSVADGRVRASFAACDGILRCLAIVMRGEGVVYQRAPKRRPMLPRPAPIPAPDWLLPQECRASHLCRHDTLAAAVAVFQHDRDLRLVPVLDTDGRPVGAVFERDVRQLLLNPFGHALLQNPAFGRDLGRLLRPCPTAEASVGIGGLLTAYARDGGSEGMVVTQGGRLLAVITNRRLLALAAEEQVHRARAREVRAERIEAAARRFHAEAGLLVRGMGDLAHVLHGNAEAMAGRAAQAGAHATAVAAASAQTHDSMTEIAARGRELALTQDGIGRHSAAARASVREMEAMVYQGAERARDLRAAAQTIDGVIGSIGRIAATVNLLALNAAIEAARAGEAGRGFAVVANEVKLLARQAAEAAATITTHVAAIRDGIDAVAADQALVEAAIGAVAELAQEVDQAVHRQQVATRTIARSVDEAVAAGAGVGQDVAAIGGSARGAAASAAEVDALALRLTGDAETLASAVERLLAALTDA
ncbi:MAG: chemotaxis protein [Staphylococcus hominis]|nr:MAG: chemotaxis protein [Staphylococcus hominis]